MAKIPAALHEYINAAFPDNTCLVGTVLPDGFAQVSPRGSVHVFDDETLAVWDRGGRGSSGRLADGTKMTVFFRNRALGARGGNGMLPAGGIARFYCTAKVYKDGAVRDKVYAGIIQPEKDADAEKKGFAVLLKVERAEDLGGKPLPEVLTAKT